MPDRHTRIEKKRVFFAFETVAPWPANLPKGRLLQEKDRHMTLLFLGEIDWSTLQTILPSCPKPQIKVGLAGHFDKCLLLPPRHPNVVAWHVAWWEQTMNLSLYQLELAAWLESHGFSVKLGDKGFLPHVTLCRRPFQELEWRQAFFPLPLFFQSLHLYESKGHLTYIPLWTYPLRPAFEKNHSTYLIRGETEEQLIVHSLSAYAFKNPELLKNGLPSHEMVPRNKKPKVETDGTLSWEFTL